MHELHSGLCKQIKIHIFQITTLLLHLISGTYNFRIIAVARLLERFDGSWVRIRR